MANLFGTYQAESNRGGYTKNLFATPQAQAAAATPPTYTTAKSPGLIPNQGEDNTHWAIKGAGIILGAPVDVIDSMAALFPGMERGAVNDAAYDMIGQPNFGRFVRENHGGVEVASGILGAIGVGIGAELAAGKLVTSGWFAATGIGQSARVQSIIQMTSRAAANASDEALRLAAQGRTLGVWEGANLKLIGAKFGEYTAKAAVSEAAVLATMNKNSAIWTDDMALNATWAALGIVGAGALGGISARGSIYRWANSDEVRFARAEVMDPKGLERDLAKLDLGAMSGKPPATIKESAEITNLALNANSLDTAAPRNNARANLRTVSIPNYLIDKMQQWTKKGTQGITDGEFGRNAPEMEHALQAIKDDPTVFYGADSLAKVPEGKTTESVLAARNKKIDSMLASTDNKVKRQAEAMKKQVPLVLVNRKLVSPKEASAVVDYPIQPESYSHPGTKSGIIQTQWKSGYSGHTYLVNESGIVNAPLNKLPIQDVIGIYEAGNRQLNLMRSKKEVFNLPTTPNYFSLDMAIEYEARGGRVNWGKYVSADNARVESLKLKDQALTSPFRRPVSALQRMTLNLPGASAHELWADPTGATLKNWLKAANTKGIDVAAMRDLRSKAMNIAGFIDDTAIDGSIDGGMFTFNKDMNKAGGEPLRPIFAFFTEPDAAKFHRWNLADAIQETKTARIQTLNNAKTAPMVSDMVQKILQHPLISKAMDISGLDDSMLAGTTNAVGAAAGQFLTQAMRFRNVDQLKAVQDMRRMIGRVTELTVNDAFLRMKKVTDSLNSVTGASSKVLFNQFYSHSPGWDIAAARVNADGMTEFVLRTDSQKNADRLGRAVQKGEVLTNQKTGKPVVLDALGEEMRNALQAETKRLWREHNVVREARGMSPLKYDPFWVPPRKTAGKHVAYLVDSADRAVSGRGLVANTEKELKSMMEAQTPTLPKGYKFFTNKRTPQFRDLWDEESINVQMASPGNITRGALAGEDINPQAVAEALDYVKHSYEQLTNGVIRTVFDAQLGIAGMRSKAQTYGGQAVKGTKNIWDTYTDTLLGLPAGVHPTGINAAAQELDNLIDRTIATAWPAVPIAQGAMRGLLDVLGYSAGMIRGQPVALARVRNFDDLQTVLAPHMPFTDAMDYARYTKGISIPWTSKGVSRGLNRFASGVILRWLEIPHAAMNMAGIITNMPGLIGNNNVPIVGRVKGANVVDHMKIMAKGFTRMLRERSSADWDYGVKIGAWSQEVAELHTQLAIIQDKNSFMKVMTGDSTFSDYAKYSGKEKAARYLKFKGVEGMASYIADTSESASRTWAHFVGLELADYHGITGMEARHEFARKIADDAIANYDPLNRPEMFSSGVGSMFGLFLSYAQNYYQRMFRWLEAEDYAAVGKSLTMQASMFGATGIPGFNQLASLIGREEDGDGLMDGIYERFGSNVGSVVAHGGFDQVINLLSFGTLPAIAFHTRGDANFRHPAGDFLTNAGKIPMPVGLEVLADITRGTLGVLDQLVMHRDTTSGQYMAEIMARQMPSRMLHGALTVLAAGGNDADVNGNIMAQTKSIAESLYRFLGLRSARQQKEIDAYFVNQKSLQIDAARLQTVRDSTRALVRAKQFDKLPAVFDDYLKAGGKPWNYPNWIENIIEDAGNTRTQNQLRDSLRGPAHQELARRIELYTGGQ